MGASPDHIRLREVLAEDCAVLSDLCLRSKAYWGYPREFMDQCRAELTLRPEDLPDMPAQLAETGGVPVGVVQIRVGGGAAERDKLFVDPDAMGAGIGRLMFQWAVGAATGGGAAALRIVSDPGAAPFYRTMGAVDAGTVPSESIPGRSLPLLILDLT